MQQDAVDPAYKKLGRDQHNILRRSRLSLSLESVVDNAMHVTSMLSEDQLECPVCWESFNDSANMPYVLWCGHTLCKSCILHLQWATMKFPAVPLQLPLFVACPWCQFLTFRFTWNGFLKYPCKNFFLVWIIEHLKTENIQQKLLDAKEQGVDDMVSHPSPYVESTASWQQQSLEDDYRMPSYEPYRRTANLSDALHRERRWAYWHQFFLKLLDFCYVLTKKLPLILLFLFISLYVLPFGSIILTIYCLITLFIAVPSFLVVYFSYPSLHWLVHEIMA
ncbi:hypothetical protein O6H91_04G036700 [Diphasiastrum complanatum]|uniref:Uncharacterized protein n=2 Tax=Diphasiastrum complanatum TaxID=34168 RepID=A0ACC2DW87_DIPCM|nr:hypothetical protein O6H91_04G036700 [Diphasiastrum complanatum]KAJ7558381.1 hypothetical protein O6H91_04G036700 [Diphasiastrum complanatum]